MNSRFGKNKTLNQTWLKSLILLVFIQMNGQLRESKNEIKFQYSVAPSLGKHQLETYNYTVAKRVKILGVESSFRMSYLNSRFTYFDVPQISGTEPYERLHILNLDINGGKELPKNWSFSLGINPRLSSNFSSGLSAEDVILGFGLGVSKRWESSVLTFGLQRSTVLGKPQLIPFASFHYEFDREFALQLGFPHSFLKYQVDERHKIKALASAEGNYYNITGGNALMGLEQPTNTKLSLSGFNFSLVHEYRIQPNISTITQIGLLTNNDFKIEDSDGQSQFTFNTNNSIYFSMGLQFNLNKNNND